MDYARSFFNMVSNGITTFVNHENTGFFLVCLLFLIGSFCWYCHIWGDENDPNSRCQSWKSMAVWMNFLAVLGAVYVIGRRKIYPEITKSNPLDKFKMQFM